MIRRQLILLLAGASIAPSFAKAQSRHATFIDDSSYAWGPIGEYFLVSRLYCETPENHQRRLDDIKREHNYRLTIRYYGANRFKIPVARDFIKYFFDNDDLNISTIAFPLRNWPDDFIDFEHLYESIYRRLPISRNTSNVIVRRHHLIEPRDVQFLERFKRSKRIDIQVRSIHEENLLQMLDLLNGVVAFGDREPVWYRRDYINAYRELKDRATSDKLSLSFF